LWRRMEDARENERGGQRGGGTGSEGGRGGRRRGGRPRPLCRKIFIHGRASGCSLTTAAYPAQGLLKRGRSAARPPKDPGKRIGKRPSKSSTEISLASLRFRIRDSRGAPNLPPPVEESELLFPLVQRTPRAARAGSTCKEPGRNIQQEIPLPHSAAIARVSSRASVAS